MFSFDTKREPEKCALCGGSYCLLSARRDAPLGQRQGGVFRFPPPYLWTPPTPQQAKGCSPLTILKKKSKHKKASAAPAVSLYDPFCENSVWSAPQSATNAKYQIILPLNMARAQRKPFQIVLSPNKNSRPAGCRAGEESFLGIIPQTAGWTGSGRRYRAAEQRCSCRRSPGALPTG